MKTIIWKELRENLKWAALAFVLLLLAEFYALTLGADPWSPTLSSPKFLMVTSFGCAIVGAALAILQILPELRRDQWASLLHRPASRSTILAGKAIAGIFYYLLATVLPFAATSAYAALPGRFASPLVPGMFIPGLSDICMGFVFYGLGLFICLQGGRWYGTRGLIILSIVPLFAWHNLSAPPFLMPLAAAAIMLAAAWGAMMGSPSSRPWLGRLSAIAIILVGAEALISLSGYLLLSLPSRTKVSNAVFQRFGVTDDGRVLIISQSSGKTSVAAADGQPFNDPAFSTEGISGNLNILAWNIGTPDAIREYYKLLPRISQVYLQYLSTSYESRENWYFLIAGNYFVGYDKLSRRRIGICDKEGFKPAGSKPVPFSHPLRTSMSGGSEITIFWAGPQIYTFDFSQRIMTPLFNADREIVYGAAAFRTSSEQSSYIAISTSNTIRFLKSDGSPIFSTPYQKDPLRWPNVSVKATPDLDRFFIQYTDHLYFLASREPSDSRPADYLFELNQLGQIQQSFDLPKSPYPPLPRTFTSLYTTFSRPLLPAVWQSFQSENPEFDLFFYRNTILPSFFVARKDLPILCVLGGVLSLVTFIWARRVGFSPLRSILWAIFVLCFGLPGLIAFRFGANWPTFVKCPACDRKRSIDTNQCPACSVAWPLPSPNGTEICDHAVFSR